MKTNIKEVKVVINDHLTFIKEKYHVEYIGVFGSVVRGENTNDSDVDVLVEFSEPVSMFLFIELEDYLSQKVGKKVDLVTKKALKSIIRDEILREVVYV